jgi:stress response protein YsnF
VRVESRGEEKPVTEQVQLREERVHVERRPVDRPVTEADAAFREGTLEVTERAEEAVVSKTAHVVEEVVVGKQVEEHTETIRDTVRRTDVDVQEVNSKKSAGSDRNR